MLLLVALPASWKAFITTRAIVANLWVQNLVAKMQQQGPLHKQSTGSQKSIALATTAKPGKDGKSGANQ